jgi:hypothetical protein
MMMNAEAREFEVSELGSQNINQRPNEVKVKAKVS